MENYFQKIIYLFGCSATEILIVTTNHSDLEACRESYPDREISHVNPEQNEWNGLSDEEKSYDLLILDRFWDETQKSQDRKNVLKKSCEYLSLDGHIICLEDNRLNLKKPASCIEAIICCMFKGGISPFSKNYKKHMGDAGFLNVKRFFLFPDLTDFDQLVSDNRRASLVFMRKSRGFTHRFPKKLGNWPKWFLVWLSIDSWLVQTHLYWGKK